MRVYAYAAILAALVAIAGGLYLKGQSDAKARLKAAQDAHNAATKDRIIDAITDPRSPDVIRGRLRDLAD